MSFIRQIFAKYVLFAGMLCLSGLILEAQSTLNGNFKSVVQSGGDLVALDLSSDLYTSSDSGANFSLRYSTPVGDNYIDLGVLGSTVVAVGEDGLILRSTNGGASWSAATSPILDLGALYAVAGRTNGANSNVWVAVGHNDLDSKIYRSTNDGSTWTVVQTETGRLFADVIWTGSHWVAVGRDDFDSGIVYRSTDGVTWTTASLSGDWLAPLLSVAMNAGGEILAVGEAGTILRSTDSGANFVQIASGLASEELTSIIANSAGTFYIGGAQKVLLQVDSGSGTTLVPPVSGGGAIEDLVLVDDAPVAVGEFEVEEIPTAPLSLQVVASTSIGLQLELSDSVASRSYYLQTSDDLEDWDTLESSAVSGTGAPLNWSVLFNGSHRFWRVQEF